MLMKEFWKNVNDNHADMLFNLWCRWQDEKEYEDIQDYLIVIQNHIPEAFKITKRPFGIHCKCDDGIIHVQLKCQGNHVKMCGKTVKKF